MPPLSGRVLVKLMLCLAAVPLMVSELPGQTTQLRGRVLDQTGSVVSGATLTLIDQFAKMIRHQRSDETGRFQFVQLQPGLFSLRVEQAGFSTLVRQNLRLEVNAPLTMDVTLQVGDISESVTVASSQPLLNQVDGTLGNTLTSDQILALPLNSRNIAEALRLQPGVTRSGEVNGSRSDQICLTLDGINVNDQYSGTNFAEPFQPVLRVTPDSIQEFRMVTSNPTATQGRSSGAQVSFVTRSGTSAFHGALYEYHRNSATSANDFFNNRAGVDPDTGIQGDPDHDGKPGIGRPGLIRNVFGGSLGGPMVQNKVFFFFNYEGRTDRRETTSIRETPLSHLGEGRMFYLNQEGRRTELEPEAIAGLYPATGGVNPAATLIFADAARRYPANDTGLGDQMNTGGYRFNAPMPLNWSALTGRLDFSLSENQKLFVRGNYQWDREAYASRWPDTPSGEFWSHPTGTSLGHTWTIGSAVTNSLRYGFTRQAISNTGDSDQSAISFRGVFAPRWFRRSASLTFPVQNIVNDTSWVVGSHSLDFGANIRLITANRSDFSDAFDSAGISYYWWSPGALTAPIRNTDLMFGAGQDVIFNKAISSLLGRYTGFDFNYTFTSDGQLRPPGSPRIRRFQTREYEFYFEDTWQISPVATLSLGLRWGVNTPVAETTGYQVQPTTSLGGYFDQRVQGAKQGVPYNELIFVDRSGPLYGRSGYYKTDWNNLAPRVSFAYSPDVKDGLLRSILGEPGQSVLRGGFAVLYDRVGTALAWSFEENNSLGFSYSVGSRNTYDVTDNLGPLFSGFDQDIRSLAEEDPPETLTFPRMQPIAAPNEWKIGRSLDDSITTPINYNWNLSFGRELSEGMMFEISYVGRSARNLLATRDIMQFNDLTDPQSGMDWYSAAAALYEYRLSNTPIESVPDIPFFENLFPDLAWAGTPTQSAYAFIARREVGGWNILDWTYLQYELDGQGLYPNMFIQPQYQALSTWSTIARSDYHALTATFRRRFQRSLTFDVNYTWSKSMDSASARQDMGIYSAAALILNALRPEDNYSASDFDVQHIVNSNWSWQLPFGTGQRWMNNLAGPLNGLLGGWSLSGIFRWNSGIPMESPLEINRWATNWNVPSWGTRVRDPGVAPHKSGTNPNYWADRLYAYNSYREAKAGDTGDRNVLRIPGYFALDLGIGKSFVMPYAEQQRLTFSCEVFNLTNTQILGPARFLQLGVDPQLATQPTPGFGNINEIQGAPRVMQFSLRYDF